MKVAIDKVKELLEDTGKSKATLAKECGWTRQYLNNLLTGITTASWEQSQKLLQPFGIEMEIHFKEIESKSK